MSENNKLKSKEFLDACIHDYLIRKNLKATAEAFREEGKVSPGPISSPAAAAAVAAGIDCPPGHFLEEWWSVFWEMYVGRARERAPGSNARP